MGGIALAWLYREDYARSGFKMLPVVEPDGESTFRMVLLYSLALLPVTLLAAPIRPTERFGGYAHPAALGTPVFKDLGAEDLIDWAGEFNSYIVPYAPFGAFSISRSLQPQLMEYLYELSFSDGDGEVLMEP